MEDAQRQKTYDTDPILRDSLNEFDWADVRREQSEFRRKSSHVINSIVEPSALHGLTSTEKRTRFEEASAELESAIMLCVDQRERFKQANEIESEEIKETYSFLLELKTRLEAYRSKVVGEVAH